MERFTSKNPRLLQDSNSTSPVVEDNFIPTLVLAGTAFVMVLLVICFVVICIRCMLKSLPKIIKSLCMTIKHKLMWSSILRYVSQSYLSTAIMCLNNLTVYNTLSLTKKVLSPFITVYLVVLPVVFFRILNRQKDLGNKETKLSLGTLYMNQDAYKRSAVHFASFFIARRFVFALTIVVIQNIVAQLYITIMCSVATLCYLVTWKPMESDI